MRVLPLNVCQVVISFSSDVFENMFESDMKEARQRMVVIEDIKANTMEKLLEFIYTKRLPENAFLPELIFAADKYNVRDLVSFPADFPFTFSFLSPRLISARLP